ncbi:MAG: phosphoribosylformylglycinamidine cyclo-ligase [Candidatus Limnocylindria bacterium]
MTTYRDAGVDVARADDALSRVRERIARTKRPEVLGDIGAFGGLFHFRGYRDPVLVATTDGVGTKLELARIMDRHEVPGRDLLNHCVNDAAAMGAEPLFFLDYFSTGRLDPSVFERVVGSIADACRDHGCALLGGETAEMPGMYADGTYDLAGFLVGAVERDAVLDPANVAPGDICIGLPSSGLHTNGYSLARAIVARVADAEGSGLRETLARHRPELGASLADALLAGHRSYLASMRALRAAAPVRAVAHLTGGGWEGNLPRALAPGQGAAISRDAWRVPPIFSWLALEGGVEETEAFDTWNMGIGLVAIVPAAAAPAALAAAPDAIQLGTVETARGDRRVRFT